ncbi:MAG: (d)CMP kinase [Chloroflexota bacterium]|nr:(d)CMP kinase [Chloroflexota bacterium]
MRPDDKKEVAPEAIPSTIAIDGPAGSGKSTVGQRLAQALGYLYFDTGVMYRAVTWLALNRGVSVGDERVVSELAERIPIDVEPLTEDDGRQFTVKADGEDITWSIREPDVEANVSRVSAYPAVRAALSAQQRRIAGRGRIVMVGRDIGTVVIPGADMKIFLDASVEVRARRRWSEEQARGTQRPFQEVLEDIRYRDRIDSTREVAPLRPAADAWVIDSTGLSVDEVLRIVLDGLTEAQPDSN